MEFKGNRWLFLLISSQENRDYLYNFFAYSWAWGQVYIEWLGQEDKVLILFLLLLLSVWVLQDAWLTISYLRSKDVAKKDTKFSKPSSLVMHLKQNFNHSNLWR